MPEALGGAHRDPAATIANVHEAVARNLAELKQLEPETLVRGRYEKFRAMGVFSREA